MKRIMVRAIIAVGLIAILAIAGIAVYVDRTITVFYKEKADRARLQQATGVPPH